MERIGFVGASGLMGHGMARNLVTKGFPLSYTVHRRNPADLADAGAVAVDGNAELGRTCDIVIICVTDSSDVEQVVAGDDGLLSDPKPGLIIVDTSTSEPSSTRRLAQLAADKGVGYVDAPMTRGPEATAAGTVNTLVGADDATFTRLEPVLRAYSENIFRCGGLGSAHTTKLLNNFLVQATCTALSEAFAVAAKAGVDPQQLVDILSAGIYESKLLHIMEATLHGDFAAMKFKLDNARKDVRYFNRLAGEHDVSTGVGSGVWEDLNAAHNAGFGDRFVPSLVEAAQAINGIQIKAGH